MSDHRHPDAVDGAPAPLLNRPRASRLMEEAGLDALVAASPFNVRYLSGYACWSESLMREWMGRPGGSQRRSQESFVVVTRSQDAALLVSAGVAADALGSWVPDVRVFGTALYGPGGSLAELPPELQRIHQAQSRRLGDDAATGLIALIRDLGLVRGVVGVDLEGMLPSTASRLVAAFPEVAFRDCSNLLRLIRMVKSDRELELLRHAAITNESAAVDVLTRARPGDSVGDIATEFARSVSAEGAEFDHFAPGLGGVSFSTGTRYTLKPDEILCVDYGCRSGGYYADAAVTLALGDLPPRLARRYELLRTAVVEVGVAATRPGTLASSAHDAMATFLTEHGIDGCFPHGHGLGLKLRDYPILVPPTGLRIADDAIDVSADLPLEPGMVICLEVADFLLGEASLEVEITVLVTESEARPFIEQERRSPIGVNGEGASA